MVAGGKCLRACLKAIGTDNFVITLRRSERKSCEDRGAIAGEKMQTRDTD